MKNLINEYYDANIKNRNKLYSKLLEIFNDEASLYNKPNFAGEHIDGTIYIDDGSLDDKVLTLHGLKQYVLHLEEVVFIFNMIIL